MGRLEFFAAPCMFTFTNDLENTVSIDFEVSNTFQQEGKFSNIESANNEDCLYVCTYIYNIFAIHHLFFNFMYNIFCIICI